MRRTVTTSDAARRVADFLRLAERRLPFDVSATEIQHQQQQRGAPFNALMISGAGISTASGIPDYRGPQGLYEKGHRPMTFKKFTSGPDAQRRYWARSFLGYPTMCRRKPNPAHIACASLLQRRIVGHLVTQNVDGLHAEAIRNHGEEKPIEPLSASSVCRSIGDPSVSELHGNIHRVRCLKCGDITTRRELQMRLAEENAALLQAYPLLAREASLDPTTSDSNDSGNGDPVLEMGSERPHKRDGVVRFQHQSPQQSQQGSPAASSLSSRAGDRDLAGAPMQLLRPDGDFEADQRWVDDFKYVGCLQCGERALKPDMVFFGESTDPVLVAGIFERVKQASCLVCVGTSMEVFSAYRFVVRAKEHGVPVAVVNSGPTRADKDAALLVNARLEDVLPYVALRFIS